MEKEGSSEGSSSTSNEIEEIDMTVVPTTKRKQSDISSFFGGSSKKKAIKPVPSKSSTSTRTLQMSTAIKWASTSLAKYNARDWLIVNESHSTKGLGRVVKMWNMYNIS